MTAALARIARHGDVAVLTLDAPPVNALSWRLRSDLLEALAAATALDALEAACDADHFDAGPARANAPYLSLHGAHAEAAASAP
jgi:hypothetical protein